MSTLSVISSDAGCHTVRFYPAGGVTTGQDWFAIATAAAEHADGQVYLCKFSGVELREVTDVAAVERLLADAPLTLTPHPVVASPLSSRARERAVELGRELEAEGPSDAQQPQGLAPLLAVREEGAELRVEEQLRGELAEEAELPIGWLADHLPEGRVDLGAGVHRGVLPAEYAQLLGHLDVDITITAWRSLVLHDIADGDADVVLRVLAPRGFIFDASSQLLRDDQA